MTKEEIKVQQDNNIALITTAFLIIFSYFLPRFIPPVHDTNLYEHVYDHSKYTKWLGRMEGQITCK